MTWRVGLPNRVAGGSVDHRAQAKCGAILTEDQPISPSLSELLKLPAGERAELAMALWESLSEAQREGELELTPEQATALDRRWMDHVQRPESAISWEEVRRKLMDRE
jgi:putative addiction module component (TIGR02574 family)